MIVKTLTVGLLATNCYIVGSETTQKGMIIDPGADPKNIIKAVRELGLSIELIVVTHNHTDHIGALRAIKDATKADYAIHEADSGGASPSMLGRMLGSVMSSSLKSPPEPARLLHDGDIIEIGDLQFKVLHTPGHSPGSISLKGNGVVFSGDTLFNMGVGRTDFPGGSYDNLMESIVTKLMVLPDSTMVYPGHGPKTTIGAEKKEEPLPEIGRGSILSLF